MRPGCNVALAKSSPMRPRQVYEGRAEAARLLAPAQVSVPGELALLATENITAAAAQKPFYVEARDAAARSATDPAQRLSLLREALAIAPGNRAVRLDAVRAALDAGKDSLALAMFRYLSGDGMRRSFAGSRYHWTRRGNQPKDFRNSVSLRSY